jgi:hypothetical protein
MHIVNGRWVDNYSNPIDERSCSQLIELGKKVQSIYGKNISYDRIILINQLNGLGETDERVISKIIDEGHLNKLISL